MLYCKYINFYNESSWPEINIEKIIACLKELLPNNIIKKEKESWLYLNSIEKEKILSLYNDAIIQDLKQPLYIYDLNYDGYNYKDIIEKRIIA
ncbi:MAG TPA: hypothetical protein VJ583_07535, partial [Nitrososphaeraceae archaeon]|nr:hypothetical protein [Nitrososphaeraceae archaeon]